MKMKRSVVACFALVAACASFANAQTVTLSLDIYYRSGVATNNGSWELRAIGSNQGIAGLDTALLNAAGPEFTAPAPAFKELFGTKPYTTDQDGNAATLDLLFGQIPVAAPGPQDLLYGVGVTGGSADRLGLSGVPGTQLPNNVMLSHGTFTAGNAPTFASLTATQANIFNAQGTATNPPAVGAIVAATVTQQTRSNVGKKRADANLDGDVDIFQLNGQGDAQILTANLGRASKGAVWGTGDFNGDKDVDIFQLNGQGDAQILTGALGSDAPAGTATASYDFQSGAIRLEIGENIGVVGFEFGAGYSDVLNPEAISGAALGAPGQKDATTLAWFNAAGVRPGSYLLGNLLPPRIDPASIDQRIGFAYSAVGADAIVAPVAVVNVPEPAAFMMAAFAAVAGLRRRRAA